VIYRHEQIGRMYVLVAAVAVLGPIVLFAYGLPPNIVSVSILGGMVSVFVFACAALARLSIAVDSAGLRWSMSFGFPSGYVAMEEIVSVEIVPVSFWTGIGVHFTRSGWVWSVALGRGVQIHRCGGLPIVLGTDQPEALVAAIGSGRSG
jgi:hypothetical protein